MTQVSGVEVTDILDNTITKLYYILGIEVPCDFMANYVSESMTGLSSLNFLGPCWQ